MMDTVDELHCAEDEVGRLTAVLERVAAFAAERPWTGLADAHGYPGYEDLLAEIQAAATSKYCRGCTIDRDTGEYDCGGTPEDESECGCPCGHPDLEVPHDEPLRAAPEGGH